MAASLKYGLVFYQLLSSLVLWPLYFGVFQPGAIRQFQCEMPQNEVILDLLCRLMENSDVKVVVKHSAMGALATGVCAGLGSLLMGPVGLAIGGTAGGIISYAASPSYHSIPHVIRHEITDREKIELVNKVRHVLGGINIVDVGLLAIQVRNNGLEQALVNLTIEFFQYYWRKNGVKF